MGHARGSHPGATIFKGTLDQFVTDHTDYANGVGAWDPASTPESQSYRITVAATTIRVRTSDDFVLTLLKATGYFVLSYLAATLAWILIPALALGWVPLVVTSGSMKPAIDRGDVVLIEPGAFARRGHVVAFIGPNGAPVLHRLQDINSDGTFVTRGDANEQLDSTPVSRIPGVGRLLIPGLGLLTMWLSELAPILVLVGAAGILIAYRRKQAIPIVVAVLVATVLVAVSATFVATTANAGSSVRTVDVALRPT